MVIDRSLVTQLDASVMDYWGTYALSGGGQHERLGDALFMRTKIPHCLFNSVILSGYDPATVDAALELAAGCARVWAAPADEKSPARMTPTRTRPDNGPAVIEIRLLRRMKALLS